MTAVFFGQRRGRSLRTAGIAVIVLAAMLGALSGVVWPAIADTSDSTYGIIRNGFSGYWDRWGFSHPSFHHRVECEPQYSGWYSSKQQCYWGYGDWSTDVYAAPGTNVTFVMGSSGGVPSAKQVWAIQPTCGYGASVGGWTVFVDVYVNNSWAGWASYGHLDEVQVSPGQWISNYQTLGKLRNWGYSAGCYEVSSDSGVHTHMEEYNNYRYACYIPWSSGTLLGASNSVGWMDRTRYTSPQQPCY